MRNDDNKLVSISFLIDETGEIENLYAIEGDNDKFILDNIPFYLYGISYGDEFCAKNDRGRLLFDKIINRGGHSTYRVKLGAGAGYDNFLKRWPPFEREGCTYEGTNMGPRLMYAIDFPPGADIQTLYKLLEDGEQEGVWEFEEGHYFQPE